MKTRALSCRWLLFFAAANSVAVAASAPVPNWPQFRGVNACGFAADANPPVNIGPQANALWHVEVPWSPSSPIVWGDALFLTTFADGQLETRCYQRADGSLRWKRGLRPERLEEFHRSDNSPATPTPVTDGKLVVSYFGSYGLICYNVAGEERWRHPLPVANTLGQYGSSASPIIAGGRVFVNRHEHGEASLLALDLATGAKAWEIARPLGSGSFGTPVVWRNANADEIVVGATGRLQGYAMRDGAERWRVDGLSTLICTTPVAGDGMLFMGAFCNASADEPLVPWEEFVKKHDRNGDGVVDLAEFPEESRDYYRGYDANLDGRITREDWDSMNAESGHRENVLLALKPGGRGDITQTHVAWKFRRGLPDVSSPLYYDGRIYLVKDGGIVSSIDAATGKPYYAQERLGGGTGNYYASPVAAADRIYFASVPGKVTVIKTGGDKPAVLHTAEFGERIIATPAIVGDRFYLRTEKQLWAF